MSTGFVHLRLHTEYSLIDSVVRVPELVEAVALAGMPAVAVTDQCNLFAMVKFYRAALARGVQPIIGVDVLLHEAEEKQGASRLTLLCQNAEGYRNLARLVSRAYLEGQGSNGVPLVHRRWFARENTGGLIALSGACEGDLGPLAAAPAPARLATAARLLARRCSRTATTSSCSAWAGRTSSNTWKPRCAWRRGAACRSSRPTMCASSGPMSSMRTRRACASRTARCWRTPCAAAAMSACSTCVSAGRDGRRVRGSARGARQFGGDRASLQPAADAGPGAAARLSGACRQRRRPRSCAAKPSAVWARAWSASGSPRTRRPRRAIAHGWRPSSTSSARWALPAIS